MPDNSCGHAVQARGRIHRLQAFDGFQPRRGHTRHRRPAPHRGPAKNGSATVEDQRQIISWPDRRTLNTRIALGITPNGAKAPTLGTIEVAFASVTDLRIHTYGDAYRPQAHRLAFSCAGHRRCQRGRSECPARPLANVGAKTIPLDTVLLSLNRDGEKVPETALRNDPPTIFFSDRPASLLVFDGEPVLEPVQGTSLSSVVNTNWPVFVDANKACGTG